MKFWKSNKVKELILLYIQKYIEQRRQFSSGGSFRPLFIIAGFLSILSKVSGKCARARMQLAARYVKMKSW